MIFSLFIYCWHFDSWSLWLFMHDLWFMTIRSKSLKIKIFFAFVCGTLLLIWYWWWCSGIIIAASSSRSQPKPWCKPNYNISEITGFLMFWFVNHNRVLGIFLVPKLNCKVVGTDERGLIGLLWLQLGLFWSSLVCSCRLTTTKWVLRPRIKSNLVDTDSIFRHGK